MMIAKVQLKVLIMMILGSVHDDHDYLDDDCIIEDHLSCLVLPLLHSLVQTNPLWL